MPDTPPPTRLAAAAQLGHVIDPEVGLNVVALGLIYDVRVEGRRVEVELTMTTPACPMSSFIVRQAGGALRLLPGVDDVHVDLVWNPPWSPQMIDPEARRGHFAVHR